MFKQVVRLMLLMIFGLLVMTSLSLTFSSSSAEAAAAAKGTEYTSSGGKHVCICSGDDCQPCATIEELDQP